MKASFLPRLFTLCLTIELLLSLSLATPAKPEFTTRSATFSKRLVFQDSFNPPDTDQPKDSSGAGSRSRVKLYQ
ncbi:hypothetical protein I8748_18640 [Nostoc sp. CENA67]|uniref:Uncharacterized protein n=1 Tax=Amazonocrinis nigriterrae CENA67 TaxID=2794033 RepID=A0A8J7HU33_9NOST|nr:hypothetical protein [Amazonocrinis nigriterrae]MBH8564180.1 hypothetical protein [Amazonocrinis nigriterrae CENA67]